MSEVVADIWKLYLLQLQLHPLRTKAITAGVLAGCSDVIAQKISGIKRLQLRRLLLIMLAGRPWSLVKSKVRENYPTVQLTAWKFWPIVGWVNYQYMPLQFRVLFHSFVASCWSVFLLLLKHDIFPMDVTLSLISYGCYIRAVFLNLKARSIGAKKDLSEEEERCRSSCHFETYLNSEL